MLDTITLMLQSFEAHILNEAHFTRINFCKLVQNSPKKSEIYYPRITIIERGTPNASFVFIEFSVPKLLFGNNFEEVQEEDFDAVIKILREKLHDMSLEVSETSLRNAKVVKVHYGKNIDVTDYSVCSTILKAIAKADVSGKLDATVTDYMNNGKVVRYHANSYELAFYDKMKDYETATKVSKKRSFEQDKFRQSGIDDITHNEILRMEFRLNSNKKIAKALPSSKNFSFADLFKQSIAQSVCLHFWDIIMSGVNPVILRDECSDDKIFQALISKGFSRLQAANLIYPIKVANRDGFRALKGISYTLSAKVKKIEITKEDLDSSYLFSVFLKIKKELQVFKAIRL